jgi:hypothetical protein
MNKLTLAIILFALLQSNAYSQDKYAVIFSATSIALNEPEKKVAANNVEVILKGLASQGFISKNIRVFDKEQGVKRFAESFNEILNQAKRDDVVFFYTDLPIRAVPSNRRISGSEYQLVLSKDSTGILLNDFAAFIKKAAAKTGNENLVFSVFDSEIIAPGTGSIMKSELNCAFSCQPGEKKVIADGVSIYTRALANAFIKGTFAVSSYQSLFYGVHREVLLQTTLQHPVLSSNDVEVFQGRFIKRKPYIPVNQKRSDSLYVINAGESMMLSTGSKIDFFLLGSTVHLPELVVAKGVVMEVNAFTALVKTNKPIHQQVSQLAAYMGDSEPEFKLNLNTDHGIADKDANTLIGKLKKGDATGYFREVKSGGDLKFINVKLIGDTFYLQLQNPVSGSIFEELRVADNYEGLAKLTNLILTHAVYKSVNNLSNTVPQLDIDWEFLNRSGKPLEFLNGVAVTYDGDEVRLKIKNNSGSRVYYGMIDMQPDRRINVIFPDYGSQPEQFYIDSGDSTEVDLEISPPFGIEKMKIFTSLQPVVMMDWFRGLSEGRSLTRGARERGTGLLPEININSMDFEIRNSAFRSDKTVSLVNHRFTKSGDKNYHTVSNNSGGTVYYNVVNQKPDGGFEVVIPSSNISAAECMIKSYSSIVRQIAQKYNPEQLITLYSDRPFNMNDYVTEERSLNDRVLEVMRFRSLSGTPISSINLIYGFEKDLAAERMRGGSDLNIRLVTPKVSLDRGGTVEAVAPKLEIAGLVYSPGNSSVKQLRVNGSPITYDDKLKLFEHEIALQTGVNRIVIEASDDKGYVATSSFQVELKSNGTNVVSATGKNYFLGVGINKYQHYDQLKNPVRDVVAFADILQKKFGYEQANIKLLLDSMATRKNIISEIRQFLKKTGPNDNVIIYLAGHGNSDPLSDGQYYFLPQEAERSDPAESGLKSTDILDPFRNINAKHCLLIIDACYSGMMTNTEAKVSPLLKGSNEGAVEEIPSKWVMASGLAVPVPDGTGDHSPFALTLMNYLKENNDPQKLRINKIQEYLEDIVPKISAQQNPTGKKIEGRGIMVFRVK